MGLFGSRKNKASTADKQASSPPIKADGVPSIPAPKGDISKSSKVEGAPSFANETSCFEFGAGGSGSEDSIVLAGYCPVSDELEPCRWQILQPWSAQAPRFRILF
ncbi:hypothetical protein O6H91_03G050200 [Diphasiastrum complanatum]|uniref:Uncharacterized protein n=1 Tax=Diphasiastrum complanatum TaxID=34168 RepID=A0ACC2E6F3_DIPCM|nr:hypothetical protein O6H91_Y259800 [Diphasiastrum complanatum]KAJ7561967.1 hypothetical protein O6H91_03G050200 [Diphasiastrum complanatum]